MPFLLQHHRSVDIAINGAHLRATVAMATLTSAQVGRRLLAPRPSRASWAVLVGPSKASGVPAIGSPRSVGQGARPGDPRELPQGLRLGSQAWVGQLRIIRIATIGSSDPQRLQSGSSPPSLRLACRSCSRSRSRGCSASARGASIQARLAGGLTVATDRRKGSRHRLRVPASQRTSNRTAAGSSPQ